MGACGQPSATLKSEPCRNILMNRKFHMEQSKRIKSTIHNLKKITQSLIPFGGMLAIFFIYQCISAIALYFFNIMSLFPTQEDAAGVAAYVIGYPCFAIMTLFFIKKYRAYRFPFPETPMKIGRKQIILYLGATLGLRGLTQIIDHLLIMNHQNVGMQNISEQTNSHVVVAAAMIDAILLAPVIEEFIFRDLTIRALEKQRYANIIQAILFTIFHYNGINVIAVFCLGLFLGHVYQRTKNIKWTIALHIFYNISPFFFTIANASV